MTILLNEKAKTKIEQLAQKYNLELVLLFGSQVTGKVHKESDYDIGYVSARKLDLDDEGRLINDLMGVVGVDDERFINLVNIKKANPLLLYAITSSCQVLYEKEPTVFARLRAFAFKQYVETKPLYEEKARRLREAIGAKTL
ncbi:MAG: nucleotidyltransferase domain-containing protein [Patescibacteria group bacterium]